MTGLRPASAVFAATTLLLTPYWILAAVAATIGGNAHLYWSSVLASWLTAATLPSVVLPCWLAYRRDPSVEQRKDLRVALACWAVLVVEALPLLFLTPQAR